MDSTTWLFWNVDTQQDFVLPKGKLYVEGAEKLRPIWNEITRFAKEKSVRVVNTADFHYYNSAELDENPDFIKTFPPHCLANTEGAQFIKETRPENAVVFDWNKQYLITPEILDPNRNRNFIIRKDAFDVFKGNPLTANLLKLIKPEAVVVYGVTTNVCVDAAVMGLVKRVKNVFVITDAIKELPGLPLPFEKWIKKKVNLVSFLELKQLVG